MPGRGARLDRGIEEAHRLLDNAGARAGRIVLFVDGPGAAPGLAMDAAEAAANAGYPVSVLGLHPDPDALEALAAAGSGRFSPVRADESDVALLLGHGAGGRRDTPDVLALTSLPSTENPAPALVGVGLFTGVLLSTTSARGVVLPMRHTVIAAATPTLLVLLVSWPIIRAGHSMWHLGASAFLLLALALRGRLGAAWLGMSAPVQVAFFAVSSVGSLLWVRPVFVNLLAPKPVSTNTDALVGQAATVIEQVPAGGVGRVRLANEEWRATSAAHIDVGETVTVHAVSGSTLTVAP